MACHSTLVKTRVVFCLWEHFNIFQLSYYGSVSENVTPRSFVLRVHATDLDVGDNGRITYEFSGEGMDAFSLNSNSGEQHLLYLHVNLTFFLKISYAESDFSS